MVGYTVEAGRDDMKIFGGIVSNTLWEEDNSANSPQDTNVLPKPSSTR